MFISWVPDAIPISITQLILHFYHIFTSFNMSIFRNEKSYYQVYGYSCRCLFEVVLDILHEEDLNYSITPFHHTSFRNIIENKIKTDKINIIDINENWNKLEEFDYSKVDIVIVSHLFGQDFNLDFIASQKKKYKFIVMEDRVQGGTVNIPFSNPCVDISFYSMGMDKRPCALGGGFVNIRPQHSLLVYKIITKINELPQESRWGRFINLVKKLPSYAIYNYSLIFKMVKKICDLGQVNLESGIQSYRKKNPGFDHNNYMKKPSSALLKSMYNSKLNYREIEENLTKKYDYFYSLLPIEYTPWKKENTLTIYNTMWISDVKKDGFLELMRINQVPYIANPTWKVLCHAPTKYQEFCNNLYYLPSLYHMNNMEIHYLNLVLRALPDFSK